MHTDDSAQRFYRSAIWSRMFPNGSFFVVLRSCRLILVHCSFYSSIAKQIHPPIQFLLAINLGCFHTQVLCNMSFSPLHCLLCLRSLESFHRMRSVSKLIMFTVHKELKSTCTETGNKILVFVFDACHEDLLANKCEKACRSIFRAPIFESAVNCTVQIGEARASNLSCFLTFRRKVQVK